jgi:hypothetical protein
MNLGYQVSEGYSEVFDMGMMNSVKMNSIVNLFILSIASFRDLETRSGEVNSRG